MEGYKKIPGPASLLASHHIAIHPGRDISCQRCLGVDEEWITRLLSMRLVDFPITSIPATDVGEAHGCRPTNKCICYGVCIFDYTCGHDIVQGNIEEEQTPSVYYLVTRRGRRVTASRAKILAAWPIDACNFTPTVLLVIL